MNRDSEFLQRLAIEMTSLNTRLRRLEAFTAKEEFKALSAEERFLLMLQCSVMAVYFVILKRRAALHGLDTERLSR